MAEPTGAGEYVRRTVVSRFINAHCPTAGRIVDLGAGVGNLHDALRPDLRASYTVVDIDGGLYGWRLVADVSATPLVDASADCVCLSDVLEHMVDDVAAVREALRIVRPGGHIVVHVPSIRTKPYRCFQRAADEAEAADQQQFPHVRDGYTRTSLAKMLEEVSGAEVVFVEPSYAAGQSLLSDLDEFLWWKGWTIARVLPWVGIRLSSRMTGRVSDQAKSSGFLAALRREDRG
jgi:SAM-dependent methyltransferase